MNDEIREELAEVKGVVMRLEGVIGRPPHDDGATRDDGSGLCRTVAELSRASRAAATSHRATARRWALAASLTAAALLEFARALHSWGTPPPAAPFAPPAAPAYGVTP